MAGSPHQTGEAHGEVPSHAAHNGATKHGAAHRPSIFSKLGKDPDVIMTMLHTIFDELKDHTETIDGVELRAVGFCLMDKLDAVSYTHLTLPTILLV